MNKEDVVSRLLDKQLPRTQVPGIFTSFFKALMEEPKLTSKLLSRKLAQTFGVPLLGILNSASKELYKGCKKERMETLVYLTGSSLELLHKVYEHACSPQEYWKQWVNFIGKLHELGKHDAVLDWTTWLIPDFLSLSSTDNELAFAGLSFVVCRGSSLVQVSSSHASLEEAYELVNGTARQLICSLKSLGTADHTALNKVYLNCFKLLFSIGKRLDCLAANNLATHSRALMIRTESFEFCAKARPFVPSDFFAFAYSSTLTAFKIAQVHKKASFSHEVVKRVKEALAIVETEYNLVADKNSRNMIELSVHLSTKAEDYPTALEMLQRLMATPTCALTALYKAKYLLEQANIKCLMKLAYHTELSKAAGVAKTALSSLTEPCVDDALEAINKLTQHVELWLKKSASIHTTASFAQPPQPDLLSSLEAVITLYPTLCKILKKSNDLDLFNYMHGLHSLLLCPSSPETLASALSSLPYSLPRYFKNIFNCCLALSTQDKNTALKVLQVLVDYLKKTKDPIDNYHTAVFELNCRLAVDFKNYFTHAKQILINYLKTQSSQLPLNELNQSELGRLIELYHKMHFEYLKQCVQMEIDLPPLELISSVALKCSCVYKLGAFMKTEVHIMHKALLQADKLSVRLTMYYAEGIQAACEWLIFHAFENSQSQKTKILIDYVNIVALKPQAFENERLLGLLTDPSQTLLQKLISTTDLLCAYAVHPAPHIWKGILSVQQIKLIELNRESEWLSKEAIVIYKSAVLAIKEGLRLAGELFRKTQKAPFDIKEAEQERVDVLRYLLLLCDVCDLSQLYSCQIEALKLCLSVSQDTKHLCLLKLRLAHAMEKVGDMHNTPELIETEEIEVTEGADDMTHKTQLWSCLLLAEWFYNRGSTVKAMNLVTKVLEATPANGYKDRRSNILKARAYFLLAKLHLIQHDASRCYGFLVESRNQLDKENSSLASLVPLDLFDSLYEQAEAAYLNKMERGGAKLIVYPHTNWSFQATSLELLKFFASFHAYSGQAFACQKFLRKYLKISRVLGLAGPAMESKTQLTETMLKAAPSYYTHIEVAEEAYPSPLDYSTNLVNYLAEFLDSSLTDGVLSLADLDSIGVFIGKSTLLEALSVLSEVQAFSRKGFQIEDEFAVNYSSFVRAALHPSLQGSVYRSLRSRMFRKQAEQLCQQSYFKEAGNLFNRSIASVGCCPSFVDALINGLTCCSNFTVSPKSHEELVLSGLGLVEVLARENQLGQIQKLLKQLPETSEVSSCKLLNLARLRYTACDEVTKAYLTFKSIGQGYTTQLLTQKPEFADPLASIGTFKSSIDELPWTVVGIACEATTRSLTISRVSRWQEPTTFNLSCSSCGSLCLESLVEEFSSVMQESASSIKNKGNSSRWWTNRERVDNNLKIWLENFQQRGLSKLSCLLLQGSFVDLKTEQLVWESAQEFSGMTNCCKQSWNESTIYCVLSAALQPSFVNEDLRELLSTLGLTTQQEAFIAKLRNLRKQKLDLTKKPVVLLIDSNLLHLPWESLPCLQRASVTRIPSYSILISKIEARPINLDKAFYILNPSKDLESTQNILEPILLAQPGWHGIIGEAPQEAEFVRAVCEFDLLLYCGHSSGEQYLRAEKLKDLKVTARAMLMGCSSGLLPPSGVYEPQGIVVAYLLAGSASIVANLWDVTDKDIDRFTLEFLKRLTQNSQSIEQALSASRQTCKLKHIIGCAPVVYGIPS